MGDTTKAPALPKEVADKYEMAIIPPGTYDIPGLGIIDFTTVSLASAKRIALKTPYLVEKEPPAKIKATTAS